MKNEAQVSIRDSIATRILLVVLGLYLLIASAAALGQLCMNYRYQRASIAQDLVDFEGTFGAGLAVNLWNMDEEALRAGVEGMLRTPTIVGVTIENVEKVSVAVGGLVAENGRSGNTGLHISLSGCSEEEKAIHEDDSSRYEMFEHQFPLIYTHKGEGIPQGYATIFSNSAVIYRRMKVECLMVVVTVALTLLTFFLALLWTVNRYLRRPLGVLTRATAGISLENLGAFSVDTKTYGKNEIRQLEETMTSMVSDLCSSVSKQKESEEQYRNLFKDNPSMYFKLGADGTVLSVNPFGAEKLGYTVDELVGTSVLDVFFPDDQERVRQKLRNCLEHPGRVFCWEFRKVCRDGSVMWVKENVRVVHEDDGKQVALVVCDDISARKRAEEELRETETRQSAMIANITDVIAIVDEKGVNSYKSPNIERWFGWRAEEVIGESTFDNIHPDDLSRIQELFNELLGTPRATGSAQCRYRCKDGSYKWIAFNAVNLQADPVIKGVLLNYHDITESMEAESREAELRERLERAARMESLGVLAGGVAHDLNNVLGPMLILPELIKEYVEEHSDSDAPDYADTIESLETIEESTRRAASVVSDLVVMGRRGQFQKTAVNVNTLVGQLLASKQVTTIQTARRDVHILKELCDEPLWCMGSESRLLRVLANLVGNAAEAIDGQGDVVVSTGRRMVVEPISGFEVVPAGDYVTIEVTDTGCGMDTKTVTRSFEPFFSTKTPSERSGSGLGLSVVHGLVKDHEGFLDLTSMPGKGTTFVIYLPSSENGVVAAELKRASMPHGNERVLVVDDEAAQQRSAGKWLKRLGYTATAASSGAEAVALFEAAKQAGQPSPFDLVMMDMVMTGMDGVAASKEIRHLYSGQKMLIVSGHAPRDLDAEARALDIAWLTKPYTASVLAHALRDVLLKPSR